MRTLCHFVGPLCVRRTTQLRGGSRRERAQMLFLRGVSPADTHARRSGDERCSRRGDRRAGVGQRKNHGGNGIDRRTAAGRPPGRAVQGGPGLHRPGLSRAGGGQAGPQPRPGAGRRGTHRSAVPARQRGIRHRRGRGRDGAVRRTHRRRHDRPGHRIDGSRRRAPGRAGDPCRRRPRPESQHGRAAARVLDVRRVHPDRRGHPQPGRLAASRGRAAAGV